MKIACLLHSLLKEIQEWVRGDRVLRFRRSHRAAPLDI